MSHKYFEENAIDIRNKKKTVFLTDQKISILDDQNIEIYGFLVRFEL